MILRITTLLLVAMLVTGCVTTPPLDFTVDTVDVAKIRKDAELKSLTVGYAPQSQQGVVQSNHLVPPLWKEALTDALNRSLAFQDDSPQKVNLSVRITSVDVPEFGIAMTTTTSALYEVIDREDGSVLFSEVIQSSATVPAGYAFAGVTRAAESVNRAVRANIENFMRRFSNSDFNRL